MVQKIALEEHFLCPGFIEYWNPTVAQMPAAKREGLLSRCTDFGEMRLASMDKAGIVRAVLSLAGPGVQAETDAASLRRVVTPDELRCLGDGDLVRIGAHTVTHPALSQLSAVRQREEIAGSRRALETVLGRRVTGFSYPFGDTGGGAPTAVHEAGFLYACESRNAVAWRGTNQFALPRFWVPDWDGQQFAGWLERWLDD